MLGWLSWVCLFAATLAFPAGVRAQSEPPPAVQSGAPDASTEGAPEGGRQEAAAAPSAPDESSPEFVRTVQFELIRVGCGAFAPDGTWDQAAQDAVMRFNEHGRWRFDPARPTRALLAALQRNEARVCPPSCEPGFELKGMTCVAIQQTTPPTPPPRRQVAPAAPSRPPARKAAPSRPAPAKKTARPRREPPPRRQAQPLRRQAQPAQRRPAECYVDLGYGRRQPCDAGGGL